MIARFFDERKNNEPSTVDAMLGLLFATFISTAPVDFCPAYLNFSNKECFYCQIGDVGLDLEERLRRAGFRKKDTIFQSAGHCLGVSLLFIEYILADPPKESDSCAKILDLFLHQVSQERAHHLQVNQPGYYVDCLKNTWVPIDPASARTCFEVLVGSAVEKYQYLRKEASRNQIDWKGEVILVGLSDVEAKTPHCFVVYTGEKKILLFDANEGLFEFADLEMLQFSEEERLTFMVSFRNSRTSSCED